MSSRRRALGAFGPVLIRFARLALAALVAVSLPACGGGAGAGLRRGPEAPPAQRLRALHEAGTPQRVVLVTVAGLQAADWLLPSGFVPGADDAARAAVRMPFLSGLAAEGSFGLAARPPSPGASFASHATLVTGLRPDRHGIVADEALDPEGERIVALQDSRLVRATTLFDAALGRGALALGWPATDGARIELIVPDVELEPGGGAWLDRVRRRSTPSLVAALEASAERALDAASRDVNGKKRTRDDWPTAGERDEAYVDAACSVAASDRDPALWLIRLAEPAQVVAAFGIGSREHAAVLARSDARLERLLGCLGESERLADTAVLVVGDVAYQPVHTEIAPNVALVREDLIGRDPRSKTGVRSWLALARSQGRSAYVFARDAESALRARRVLEEEATRSGVFEVVPAAELAREGADREAWFGLEARPGHRFGNALSGPLLRPADVRSSAGGFSGRDPVSTSVGFLAWGRGIRGGFRVPTLEQVDVAPTIARLLGLRLDEKPDGRPLIGLLRASQPLPPPGPKRLGVGSGGDVDETLRELGGGRELGSE